MAGAEREWQTIQRIELSTGLSLGMLDEVTYSELVLDIERLAEAS